jgi:phage regulator Rha-like protein
MGDNLSQELVVVQIEGESRIDSRVVAKSIGIEHHNLIATIRKHQKEIEEELGILLFQTEEIKGRGQPEKYAMLTEDQAVAVVNLSRNTKQVVAFKIKLAKAFVEARARLASKTPSIEEQIFTKDVQRRCMLNEKLLKPGFWCVVTEMWREAWALEAFQKELKPSSLPDGSCGTKWRNHLKSISNPLLRNSYQAYLHIPNNKNLFKVWVYPDELLTTFRRWLRVEYAEYYDTKYLPSRLKDAEEIKAPKSKKRLK